MDVVAKMDEWGRPAWIIAMILGFVFFWPVGLAILAYMIWSRRMGCMHHGWDREMRDEWRQKREEMRREWREKKKEWRAHMHGHWHPGYETGPSSGNAAFDDYKAETLRRLEEEQDEFTGFLDRLRKSKDQAEFDQFMAERRRNAETREREAGNDSPDPRPEDGPRGNS